jgi:hypothetical protein
MHSISKHFDPAELEADLPSDRGFDRDEVGLVRAICVKVPLFVHLISN